MRECVNDCVCVCAVFSVCFLRLCSKGVARAMATIFEATFFLCTDHKHTLSLCSVFVRGWTDPNRQSDGRTDGTDEQKKKKK